MQCASATAARASERPTVNFIVSMGSRLDCRIRCSFGSLKQVVDENSLLIPSCYIWQSAMRALEEGLCPHVAFGMLALDCR